MDTDRCVHRHFVIRIGFESLIEGPEGVKWELGFAYFSTRKMGFGDWDWEKSSE